MRTKLIKEIENLEKRSRVHSDTPAILPPGAIRRLSGFGMALRADGFVFNPESEEEILDLFALARASGRQVVLRGAARSYGDAAIGNECIILDTGRFRQVLQWDEFTGVLDAGPRFTLEDIWRLILPSGWWLPVVSGTTRTSIGGALAMNIHGKNNFTRGPIGEHVQEIDVLFTTGEKRTLTPKDDLFFAVIGGLGLLGVITRIKLQMKPVSSGYVRQEAVSCANWNEQFAAFDRFEGKAEYVVSWIDCFGSGAAEGRGILHAAWHKDEAPGTSSLKLDHQHLPPKIMGIFPKSQVWRILKQFNNRTGMRFINAVKHGLGKHREHGHVAELSLAKYNFLLDYVPGWERAYLPGGLIQCQYFVPREYARDVFSAIIRMQQEAKMESYLAVMKRHRPDKFLLSHAVDGYSLALDFKVTAANRGALWELARRMNEFALGHGGRFYFAKDATLTADQAHAFLGDGLKRFNELKKRLDPDDLLTSDLAKRLSLIA